MALPIKIDLPTHFLDAETRSGVQVSSKLKKVWAVELDLVSELKRVCDKYGIRFMLAYGTLIGAIRHKGFIPWDDDFDVWIPRDDFEKLCALAKDEFKHPYFLQTALSDRMLYFPYARLRNSDTTGAIVGHESVDYNNGIYIDIYVIDGYTDSKFLYNLQTILRNVGLKLCTMKWPQRKGHGVVHCITSWVRPFVRLFPFETCDRISRTILAMFNSSAKRFGPRYRKHPNAWNWWIEKDSFDNLVELPFENLMLPCPRNYDEHLRRMYGDYMQFPKDRGRYHDGIIHFEPEIPYVEYISQKKGE